MLFLSSKTEKTDKKIVSPVRCGGGNWRELNGCLDQECVRNGGLVDMQFQIYWIWSGTVMASDKSTECATP